MYNPDPKISKFMKINDLGLKEKKKRKKEYNYKRKVSGDCGKYLDLYGVNE